MAINKNHEFEDLNGVKCAVVEKNASQQRVDFLQTLLELNGFTVVVVPSPPPKAVPPPSGIPKPAEGEAAAPAAPAVPAENLPPLEPIVVKKKIEGDHAGAHGGAWKIALADMMTAMMAFFLLMWLLSATNEDQRKSIAE